MQDSIPAPEADFSSSIWLLKMSKKNKAPRPSPNPSPFIFSIKLIYYIKVRKMQNESKFSNLPALTESSGNEKMQPIFKPFHRSVNSVDAQLLKEVKTKQILFYHDLVSWNDLTKLFNVLDKTPSSTSLSICKERIKNDLNKIVMYEEELASLYELVDKVGEYFEMIGFESNFDLLNDDVEAQHLGKTMNSNFPFNK